MNRAPRRPRGRPKLIWDPFDDELFRRFQSGEALPLLELEAKYLAAWGKAKNLHVEGGEPIKAERIRERIKKRYPPGAQGYKWARAFVRAEFLQNPNSDGREPSKI
jgi:hypothetical protein